MAEKEEQNITRLPNDSSPCRLKCGTFEEADSNFRTIFDLVSDGMLIGRFGEKKFTDANKKICEMLGYTKEELLGLGLHDIIPSEHLSSITQQAQKTSRNEITITHDIPVLRKDKSVCLTDVTRGSIILHGKEYHVSVFRDSTERKLAEEMIVASEEKYRTLLNNIQDAIFIIKDGKVKYANKVFSKIVDYSEEELIGKSIEELVAPEDLAMVSDRYIRRMKGEQVTAEYEFRLVKKDRVTRVDVRMSVGTTIYEGGLAALGTGKDVTLQKRAEETLRRKEASLRYAQSQAHLGSWEINLSAQTYSWSEEMFRIFGFDSTSGVPTFEKCESIIHPDDRERVRICFNQSLSSQKPFHDEYRVIKPEGRLCWVEARGKPIFDYKGKMVEFSGTVQDITERKQMENELITSESNFRHSLDDSPLGVRVVTLNGETIYANKAILDIYGYDNIDEMRNTPLNKRYTPESYAEYQKRNEKRLKGERGPSEYNVSIVTKNGEVRHLHVLRKDIVWNGKKHYQVIYQDITDRRKAEEKLSQTLENLRQSIKATIQVLGMASEARDPYTAGHHKRVSNLARAIAVEKRLSQDIVEGIRMAGSIHDIGKLSVPGEILSKPTKLTDLEFSLIKEHSQSGYEMLKHVESPWPLAQIVQQHHERMDGTGYPQNLKGNEILIEARIIAVADVVEAMASHRPYRPALGIEAALDEIEKNKGILYDENVVDTCLSLFRDKGYKLT